MSKKRYSRFEEEIIQILDDAEHEPLPRRLQRRWTRRVRRPPLPRVRTTDSLATSWLWIGASFILALAAILVADRSELLAVFLAIASIVVFLSPIVLARRGPLPTKTVHRWRGKDIDLPPGRAGFVGEIRYRWWEWRRRH